MSNAPPKAFISYSHDSQEHKKWVLDLATRLRMNGVEAVLDQWSLGPGDDLPAFMERNLAAADRVLMVCTDNYVAKANSGAGGVGYEKMIMTADLLQRIDQNKVIPLIRQNGSHDVPHFMRSKMYLNFSRADEFEFAFDELSRALHRAPLFVAPPVSQSPFKPIEQAPVDKSGDGVKKVMMALVHQFESQSFDLLGYDHVLKRAGMSRIMFDLFAKEAIAQGYAHARTHSGRAYFLLTDAGREYAIVHRMVG